jgi:putative transposase
LGQVECKDLHREIQIKRELLTSDQAISILREAATGNVSVVELCRKYGISEVVFYRWRNPYQATSVSHVRRLKRPPDLR